MTELEAFQALIADLGAADIGQIQERLDTQAFWNDDFFQDAMRRAKRSKIRQLMRQLKDERGRPLWYSVRDTDEQGQEHTRYKQASLFTKENYLQVITYATRKVQYWQREAETLRDAMSKRYGEQLTLPWE